MPRYFVSGLCMQGNKGGPALALSLMSAMRQYIPDAEFVFSVPGDNKEWPYEQEWAEKYGVEVVKNINLHNIVPPFCFSSGRFQQLKMWWTTLKGCDALIQVSAICYTGPPSGPGTLLSMIGSTRVQDFFISKLACRSMFAWTQSYGPFSSNYVRFFARMDLRRQKIIFCRGNDCRDEVRKLLPEADAKSFPDVAVTLPYDKEWGAKYLSGKYSGVRPVVSLSPSAVLYSRAGTLNGENQHITQLLSVVRVLISMGYSVLLVPHTYRPAQPDPRVCDLEVARLVVSVISDPNVMIVEENLSPNELKSIISKVEFHVGARYHSVVAALSSCVPAVSMSWHSKYLDLMRCYGMDDYVLEENSSSEVITRMLEQISMHKDKLGVMLKK
ncbi:MAG: polysaccharide pyruvyl transferase family protein [Nitrospinae bacterium]|nr:polysaccharide pyruvyl transferase family protein [Nitrospinota bacterium]